MRFPFSLTRSMTGYLLKKKLMGERRFPMVLMLEPLHACNLNCTGCGRIREYADWAKSRLSVEQCMAAVDECDAPIVSICGGEPLIYPHIQELVEEILKRRKHIYLCTNGVELEKKLGLFTPSDRLFINVHIDGMEQTHDAMVQREGVFTKAVSGLRAAKEAGFMVCTNTTVYRETDIHEVAVLLEYLSQFAVDGFMLSPAYGYEAVCEDDPQGGASIFMTRDEIHTRFREAREMLSRYRLVTSPVYFDFLCGERDLTCAAWANPTYNVRGWKGPCYLVTDEHYRTYRELVDATDWDRLGPGNDPRCEHCLVHCGFEPAAVFSANRHIRDMLKMAVWQMG